MSGWSDIGYADDACLRVQSAGYFNIFSIVLFGFLLVIQKETLSRIFVNQQGILATLRLDDLTHESLILLLSWLLVLLLSTRSLVLRLGPQCRSELDKRHRKSQRRE